MYSVKKHIFFLAFAALIFFQYFSFAQSDQRDSLKKLLYKTAEDTQYVNILCTIAKQYIFTGDYDSGRVYAERAEELCNKLNFNKGKARVYTFYGVIYFNRGNYPESLKNYFTSLKIRETIGDKRGMAATYHNIGNVYNSQENDQAAMRNFLLSIKIKREIKDTLDPHYAHTLNNIGVLNIHKANYKEAMKYLVIALKIEKERGDVQGAVSTYNNMANISMDLGKYEEALTYYFTCYDMEEKLGDREGLSTLFNNMGNTYLKWGKPKEAFSYINKALKLAMEIGSKEDIKISYEHLAEADELTGNYMQSLKNYKLFIAYRDSLNNEEITKKTVRAEMNFEFDKREAEAKLEQEKREVISAAESRKQKIVIWSVCGILVLVFAFAVFAYRSYRQKQKANEAIIRQKEIIEEKQKEILDSIHYAKRIQIALLPHERYIERNLNQLKKNV